MFHFYRLPTYLGETGARRARGAKRVSQITLSVFIAAFQKTICAFDMIFVVLILDFRRNALFLMFL